MSKAAAIEAYREGELSVNEAACIAGVSVGEWLEIARQEGLEHQLSVEDLEADVESARKL